MAVETPKKLKAQTAGKADDMVADTPSESMMALPLALDSLWHARKSAKHL